MNSGRGIKALASDGANAHNMTDAQNAAAAETVMTMPHSQMIHHCPTCDQLCVVAHKAVDDAVASGAMVLISCHHCGEQFAPVTNARPMAGPYKTGRAATIVIKNCTSCQQLISVPDTFPDARVIDMICPLCDRKLDIDKLRQQETADDDAVTDDTASRPTPDITADKKTRPQRDRDINRVPLYLLIVASLAGYLYWARETGQLPIDQWLRLLGFIS
jgi:DNA-directed RNA polymerase subunit M/transcription elongation factor TFIIS